jgi:hypothetical protein
LDGVRASGWRCEEVWRSRHGLGPEAACEAAAYEVEEGEVGEDELEELSGERWKERGEEEHDIRW